MRKPNEDQMRYELSLWYIDNFDQSPPECLMKYPEFFYTMGDWFRKYICTYGKLDPAFAGLFGKIDVSRGIIPYTTRKRLQIDISGGT